MREIAYAKVNIFLKIVGLRGNYHEISSRFMQVSDLFDEIEFIKKDRADSNFELIGDFSCPLEKNTIYKAYNLLKDDKRVVDFFNEYRVVVKKNIPEFAGLGGGSSDSASFLRLTNRVLDLGFNLDRLSHIGSKIGADVSFFIYNFKSANVSGIGEVVEEFKEDSLEFETLTPHTKCDTAKVYQKFRESFLTNIDIDFAKKLREINSKEILKSYKREELNDLFLPALKLYPDLSGYEGFFSGSGSTFFKVVEDEA